VASRAVDDLDRAIIRCLQSDGRLPSAEIARKLSVAERTVRARIERLIADDVIRLVAQLVPSTLGFGVTADVFLEVEAGRVHDVANLVASKPEVGYVGLTTGDRDISIQLYAESVESLYDFVTDELGRIPGVVRHKTFIIPKIVKMHFDYLGPEGQRNGAALES
jgi:Lrp/AsnC family transcriptional regulator for asnA, asnC and gidA